MEVINLPDPNLEQTVIEGLLPKLEPTTRIYNVELTNCPHIDANFKGITNLTGMKHFTHTTTAAFRWNSIVDLSPMTGMVNLLDLSLYHNQITNATDLASLTSLTNLNLNHNSISSLSFLPGMTNLHMLLLNNNQVFQKYQALLENAIKNESSV